MYDWIENDKLLSYSDDRNPLDRRGISSSVEHGLPSSFLGSRLSNIAEWTRLGCTQIPLNGSVLPPEHRWVE